MLLEEIKNAKLTFSGHDTFHCRHLWLKKGYDFINAGKKFSDIDAVVELGVGKNMVSAIQHWMKAFGLMDKNTKLTDFAHYIFSEDTGKDPYLEDDATLWLLHYQLIKQDYASIYNLFFNNLRKERLEFSKENAVMYLSKKVEEAKQNAVSRNTLESDFDAFIKTYLRGDISAKEKEDSLSGILVDLDLLQDEKRIDDDKKITNFYSINKNSNTQIADEILLFVILDNEDFKQSISLNKLELDNNQLGNVFLMNKSEISNRLTTIAENRNFQNFNIVYSDQAGIKELQIKNRLDKFTALDIYYAN